VNDRTESLVTLALGDPSLIPPAFADVLDAIVVVDTESDIGGHSTLVDQIVDELDDNKMEILKTIMEIIILRQTTTMTFTEWLSTEPARRISHSHVIAKIMDENDDWPRNAKLYGEYRDYVVGKYPDASHVIGHAWGHYRNQTRHMSSATPKTTDPWSSSTSVQYAACISWANGHDEIHPKTLDGTNRYEAEQNARRYNYDVMVDSRNNGTDVPASASVVRRTVVYGPWYHAV